MRCFARSSSRALLCCFALLHSVQAFYVPGKSLLYPPRLLLSAATRAYIDANICSEGFAFNTYNDGESIPLYVNKIYSDNSVLKFSYAELPFVCPPSGKQHASQISGSSLSLNLGEIFRGDRIIASDFDIRMNTNDEIHFLCSQAIDREELLRAQALVGGGYVAEWVSWS